jgi:glucose-1-phosphate thymidylyltransferase
LDTGTHESCSTRHSSRRSRRKGKKIACLEEVAFRMGFISRDQLAELTVHMASNNYRAYLEGVVKEADGRSW